MKKMSQRDKEILFYMLGFLIFVGITGVDRYITEIPGTIYMGLMALAVIFLFIGLKVSGKKLDWDFDLSFSGRNTRRVNKRKNKQKDKTNQ